MNSLIHFESRGSAAWLYLDRPEKRNALSPEMIHELMAALQRASDDPDVRSIVISGRGPAFCAGGDLGAGSDLAAGGEANPFVSLLKQLQTVPKPVILAVNGPAFGGGLGLVAAADIVVAASTASFSFSEVRLGLVPAMISVVVLPKIGLHQMRRLFLTGRRFTAEEAVHYGLVHRVTPPGDLEAAVRVEVADVAKGGPKAVAAAKRWLSELSTLPEDEAFDRAARWFGELVESDEAREGMAAFTEKRPPRW